MKTIKLFCLLLLTGLSLISQAQNVNFSSKTPVAGSVVDFVYNPSGTKLDKKTDITCKAFVFKNERSKEQKVSLVKNGDSYKGSVNTIDSAQLVLLSFSSGEERDENPEGYSTLLYKDGKALPGANYMLGSLYLGFGKYLAGMAIDNKKALANMEKELELYPANKDKYLTTYYSAMYSADKSKATPLIKTYINELNSKPNRSEKDLASVMNLYSAMKMKKESDSVRQFIANKYPSGNVAFGMVMTKIYEEKSAAKMVAIKEKAVRELHLDKNKPADQSKLNSMDAMIAETFGNEKNYLRFEEYAKKITNKMNLAQLYNSVAWPMAEKKESPIVAERFSKRSLQLIDETRKDPKAMPSGMDANDWQKNLNNTYGMFADTYALIQHNMGKKKEALTYQEIAFANDKGKSVDITQRYTQFLAEAGQADKAHQQLEKSIKSGVYNTAMKKQLEGLYLKKYGNAKNYRAFIDPIEKAAKEKTRAELIKQMISEDAPNFTLLNTKGEKVSLADYRGKVVVLDFWATWCGPCKASFPGMQTAVSKFEKDPNVAFLFIDTWERGAEPLKAVKDFIASNKYTFHVLMDTPKKDDPDKFDVVDSYKVSGIPTKFVVDKNGKIRFKAVGYSGSADKLVEEMDIMIGMAAQ